MLKRIYTKKIIVCMVAMFAILLVYILPSEENKLSYKEELEYVNSNIKTSAIFLLDSSNYLACTEVVTKSTNTIDKAKELIEALTIDGKKQDNIPSGFKAIIPSNTKVRSITYDNETIKIDFTKELMNTSIEFEEKIIEAITFTLTSLKDVKYVIIFMDGEILSKLPQSKIILPSTLDRSFGINKEYNISSTKDINKTTIYYISQFNDTKYYVPATKINNDTRKKIEIIVDELSSSNIYRTNLMSFLNGNTKLISTEELGDELIVNFNSAIFNDINSKEILEEVIYTICMSISDNYNVSSIILNVDDEEIYKSVLKTIE